MQRTRDRERISHVSAIKSGLSGSVRWVILIAVVLCLGGASQAMAGPTVKVGVYQNRPLVFIAPGGAVQGLFVDIIDYVAAQEKWKVRYVKGSWAQLLSWLKRGQIDLLADIAYTKPRTKWASFNRRSVLMNWGQVYVPRGSKVGSVTGLAGKRVAVVKGDIHQKNFRRLIARAGVKCRLIEVESYGRAVALTAAKKVDAGVVNRFFTLSPGTAKAVFKTGITFGKIDLRYAAPKGKNLKLLGAIDRHLSALKKNRKSVYYKSLARWLGLRR